MVSSSNKTDTKYAHLEQKASPNTLAGYGYPAVGGQKTGARCDLEGRRVGGPRESAFSTLFGPAFGLAELEFPLDGLADEIHADFRFLKNGSDALKRPLREFHGRSLMPQLFAPHAGRNNRFCAHCHDFVGLYVLTGIVGPNI